MTQTRIRFAAQQNAQLRKVEGANVWNRRDIADSTDFVRTLTGPQIDSLMKALRTVKARGTAIEQMRRQQFPVADLKDLFRELALTLQHGSGFGLLRGLPLDDLSDDDCKLLFWGIGMQLGMPVNQSRKLEMLAEVRDVGEKVGDPTTRAFRSPGALRFHTDQCDVLGLMCVRGALEGGHSRVVSSATVHNALFEESPALLASLYEPFYFSRQGEEIALVSFTLTNAMFLA